MFVMLHICNGLGLFMIKVQFVTLRYHEATLATSHSVLICGNLQIRENLREILRLVYNHPLEIFGKKRLGGKMHLSKRGGIFKVGVGQVGKHLVAQRDLARLTRTGQSYDGQKLEKPFY